MNEISELKAFGHTATMAVSIPSELMRYLKATYPTNLSKQVAFILAKHLLTIEGPAEKMQYSLLKYRETLETTYTKFDKSAPEKILLQPPTHFDTAFDLVRYALKKHVIHGEEKVDILNLREIVRYEIIMYREETRNNRPGTKNRKIFTLSEGYAALNYLMRNGYREAIES